MGASRESIGFPQIESLSGWKVALLKFQIDEEIVIDSRVKKFEHGKRKYASLRISTILLQQLCAAGGRSFCFLLLKGLKRRNIWRLVRCSGG